MYPTRIEDLGVRLANEQEWWFLMRTMGSKDFGTRMDVEDHVGRVNVN